MPRRRNNESVLEILMSAVFDILVRLPWWASIGAGVALYVLLRVVLPAASSGFALFIATLFLVPAAASAIYSARKRRMLDAQTGIESIRALSWRQFEELLAEAFRRKGYAVEENLYGGADGGVDLVLRKGGSVYLVQCKQWRAFKVGVQVVREMLGLVTARSAQGGIIVTSGRFTREAESFASQNELLLIDGKQLAVLIRGVQTRPASPQRAGLGLGDRAGGPSDLRSVKSSSGRLPCPRCDGELVLREARRGEQAGSKFWGCSHYPKCRHTAIYES